MLEELKDKPVVRDIEICKRCKYFKQVNNDDELHRGIGVCCSNHIKYAPWCSNTSEAVTEEDFERVEKIHIFFEDRCLQMNQDK